MGDFGTSGRWNNPGGTPGGIGEFLMGIVLATSGLWLFMGRVVVHSRGFMHGWFDTQFGGQGTVAVILIPFVIGVGGLFVNGRSVWAWAVVTASLALMVLTVLMSLELTFLPTSLPAVLGMVAMVGAGCGLLVRSLKDHSA
ncbi:MAG: hypothetical protein CMH53_05260 [Myxococcales bacterium]|nr:hypothetical protein [Myxococcales bacterium]